MKYLLLVITGIILTSGCGQLQEIRTGPSLSKEHYLPITQYAKRDGVSLDFEGVRASYTQIRWKRKSPADCRGESDLRIYLEYEDKYVTLGVCPEGTCGVKQSLRKPLYKVRVEIHCPSEVWVTAMND